MSAFRRSNPQGVTPELSLPPVLLDNARRADMTVSCRDCELIPKVQDAGKVISLDGRPVQIMHNGVRVVAGGYYGDWMTDIIERLQGHHEPQEEAVFHEILKHLAPDATMLELGGFWSYYSLWFKSAHGDQPQAYVVEPTPAHIAVGRANAALNDSEITFVQGCVGAEPIRAVTFPTESAGNIRIPQISIASFCASIESRGSMFFIAIRRARKPRSSGHARPCFTTTLSASEFSRPTAITSAETL
jgi:hypothetical protein